MHQHPHVVSVLFSVESYWVDDGFMDEFMNSEGEIETYWEDCGFYEPDVYIHDLDLILDGDNKTTLREITRLIERACCSGENIANLKVVNPIHETGSI